jgi:ubiquinone/menaquinone biosynthesis C-methylase UbiE
MDVASAARSPFPYVHGSADTVGNQLMAIGYIIKAMALPKGARILEFGPGWGNTTIALAKMGYDVTAIDIERNFVELIAERARMEDLDRLKVVVGDFFNIETIEESFDAILFFECFHHCANHLRLIRSFDRALKPGGIVCFGAEPIVDEFPIPWGLRMDGQSLWAIRRNGWMELGFNSRYFERTMNRYGWTLQNHQGLDSPWSKAIIARRANERPEAWDYGPRGLRFTVGRLHDSRLSADGRQGFLMFGPYTTRPSGNYVASVSFDERAQRKGKLQIDICCSNGSEMLAKNTVDLASSRSPIRLPFILTRTVQDLEIRVQCDESTAVTLDGAELALNEAMHVN